MTLWEIAHRSAMTIKDVGGAWASYSSCKVGAPVYRGDGRIAALTMFARNDKQAQKRRLRNIRERAKGSPRHYTRRYKYPQ